MTLLRTTLYFIAFLAHLAAAACSQTLAIPGDSPRIIITATARAYAEGELVRLPLPEKDRSDSSIRVVATESQTVLPTQVIDSAFKDKRVVWFRLAKAVAVGESREFAIVPASPPSLAPPLVSVRDTGAALIFAVNEKPVIQYNTAIVAGPSPEYSRSGFIHPVYTPGGAVLTDGMPEQHTHQHGIMFAWVRASLGSEEVDFWNCHQSRGRVKHVDIVETHQGALVGEATVRLSHYLAGDADREPVPALDGTWTIRVFSNDAGTDTPFVWEIEITQKAVEEPLMVHQHHYGGLGIRGSADWMRTDAVKFLTADGKDRQHGNHTRPAWASIYDSSQGQNASLTVLSPADNFRGPQWTRLHPTLPYFCFLPVVEQGFPITASKPYTARFRFMAADTLPQTQQLEIMHRKLENALVAKLKVQHE